MKPKWLEHDKRILDWERDPDGIFVQTGYGFAFDPDPDENSAGHIHIYQNSKEARSEIKHIRPCTCQRCLSGMEKTNDTA